ncbi:SGNH/GDSL hydrolase family protein [Staphylococcus haemolyticus]|uniref:SGNH/GDSL hydrolase family protein n=1 Tax=Staphylococcus haemolyticus TaxID=1283 RepID=A0AB38PGL5_STAHA|nr:SGNH/GDSL hydrolase family protein [Staphylococcus haemolyticus]PTK52502.1 SGNH/GDSL hydrolase family protein [Staphylococcus haemolyticus]TRL79233.1 SGNH/GDSL hydrolase family protein [Staphylococcus haemolyticus]
MKLNLSPIFRDFKNDVEQNFKELAEKLPEVKEKSIIEKMINDSFNKKYDQLQKEIRAIVLPEMSPLEITSQFEDSKTDLKGIKHQNLSERIQKDINNLIEKYQLNSFKVTQNGSMVTDYYKYSSELENITKIHCIGDSVAKGLRATKNFGEYLSDRLNAPVVNLAVSGATMSETYSNSIFSQASKVREGNLVIVQGTDDDWIKNIAIGTNKSDTSTFYGAFIQTIRKLQENNNNVKIIVMTATRQLPINKQGEIYRKDTDRNNLGLTLEDYVNAQVLACSELKVPVFDAYHTTIFDPYNPAYCHKNMTDGLHPNELAHELIAYELIKNFYYFYG